MENGDWPVRCNLVGMPRKNLIRSSTLPYHVTARANTREAFPSDLTEVWDIFSDSCLDATFVHGVEIHALVVMPNHFHLLISTPQSDLGVVMERFMASATKTMNRISGRSGRVFGGPYHWSLIDSTLYFANALKYVYRNPVRAGLCRDAEAYSFSTLSGLRGNGRLPFPLYFPFGLCGFLGIPDDPTGLVQWLNRTWSAEREAVIREGLKRTTFCPPKTGWKRCVETLEL